MAKKRHCKYCGCKVTNQTDICNNCVEKLRLIRKLRAIVFSIKRAAETERKKKHEQTGNDRDAETVQRPAC